MKIKILPLYATATSSAKPAGVCATKQRQEQQPTKVKYKIAITSGS